MEAHVGWGQHPMLQRQEATQTLLVLLDHPVRLPQGEKPGSWARGKLGGSVCDQGNGYSSGKWLSSLLGIPLSLVPPGTPTLTRSLFSSFIMWLASSSPFVLLAAF